MFRLGLALCLTTFVACWANVSAEDYKCSTKLDYDWPRKDSCWRYYECKQGQEAPSSGWCFPLIRRFDRIDRKCTWWFRVDCSRDPGPEPQPTADVKPDDSDKKPETPDQKPEEPKENPEPEKKTDEKQVDQTKTEAKNHPKLLAKIRTA